VTSLALVSLIVAPLAKPLWLSMDQELSVARSAYEAADRLGVALDPWGSPLMDPARPGAFPLLEQDHRADSPRHRVSLHRVVTPSTEQTRPQAGLARLSELCRLLAAEREEADVAGARELLSAAEVAEASVAGVPKVLRFPRSGPYPYAFVTNLKGYYTTQLSAYSFGPNRMDELGFGDDVRFDDSNRMRDRLGIFETGSWLVPVVAGVFLIGVQLVSLLIPVSLRARGELVVALVIGAGSAVALRLLLGEAIRGDPTWGSILEALGVPGGDWTELRLKTGLPLLGGALASLAALFLRLPQVISSETELARRYAEREVVRLEGTFGGSAPEVAQALETLATLAGEAGDLDAAREAAGRAEKIRTVLGPYLDPPSQN